MKRGDIWTVSAGGYARKPRPAVIVQDDHFDATASVTICLFTSNPVEAPHLRLLIEPSPENGLGVPSRLMVDKVVTVDRGRLGRHIGRLSEPDMTRVDRSLIVFLGLAGRD